MAEKKIKEEIKEVKEVKEIKKKKVNPVFAKLNKKMQNKEICRGIVSVVKYDDKLGTEILMLDVNGYKGIIRKEDVDLSLNIPSLVNFVGREVTFTIININEKTKTVYCSRKEAQRFVKKDIENRLIDGEAFYGQIVNILPHGAYIDIDGVSGLLKNVDFAEDYTTIAEKYAQGDKIQVKLRKISNNGLYIFEATKKICSKTLLNINDIEKDQVILGVVRSIKPFGTFVNIAPYIDVLCSSSEVPEFDEDRKVQIKITDVYDADMNGKTIKRFKGKIIKLL